jgi:glycerophosphoryl diester phosphodiesterase
MPFRPLAADAGRVQLCAHRGASMQAPENTLPALAEAARLGADLCEIDVVLAADGEIVLMHDELLDRTTDGSGPVAQRSLAELKRLDAGAWFGPGFTGTRIPTLAEALALARELGIGLLIELKERRRVDLLMRHLLALLAQTGAFEDALVISFDHPSLARLVALEPRVRTELITHARHLDPAGLARRAGASSLAIEWDMFHPADAAALHVAGVAVRVTVPRPERMALRRRHGLDDEALLEAALRRGDIDVLAGDDVQGLVALCAALRPIRAKVG